MSTSTDESSSDAERAITREISHLQHLAAVRWQGNEKQATIEIVRTLDTATVARTFVDSQSPSDDIEDTIQYITLGAAAALRPFLRAIRGTTDGVPWARSSPESIGFCYSYLRQCGQLANLLRLAGSEHYGLASTSAKNGRIVIETTMPGMPEIAGFAAMVEWQASRAAAAPRTRAERRRSQRLRERMRGYVDKDYEFFIRYDNDLEIVQEYLEEAQRIGRQFFEGEALPLDVQLGTRTFGEWKDACERCLGRILSHIQFAALLHDKHPEIALRDVLTIFVRRDDAAEVWKESGMRATDVDATMTALSLDCDTLEGWDLSHEIPTPFYIDFGRDFVLLPCFGALSNPYYALFRHLRSAYRSDWDRGVDRREDIFRSNLSFVFHSPRFVVPDRGFKLRREDKSIITDIDAAVYDRHTGDLALVQLKWHDIFGRSLAERESRRRNLGKAVEWVERVSQWIDARPSRDVAGSLGIADSGSDRPPVIWVMARYAAQFSGDDRPDDRATWLAWPELLKALDYCRDNPIRDLPAFLDQLRVPSPDIPEIHEQFRFQHVTVDLHVRGIRGAG